MTDYDWSEVEALAKEYVRLLEEEYRLEPDLDHLIAEAVLVVIFGDDIFDRINPLIKVYN